MLIKADYQEVDPGTFRSMLLEAGRWTLHVMAIATVVLGTAAAGFWHSTVGLGGWLSTVAIIAVSAALAVIFSAIAEGLAFVASAFRRQAIPTGEVAEPQPAPRPAFSIRRFDSGFDSSVSATA